MEIHQLPVSKLEYITERVEHCLISAQSEQAKRILYRVGLKANELSYQQPGVFHKFADWLGWH